MNLKKIFIYDFDILFNILNEVKEKLNFEFEKIDQKNLQSFKKEKTSNHLIISSSETEYFVNPLVIKEKPIKLEKIIEMINLKLLKDNFNIQSHVKIGDYELNLNSREIRKYEKKVDLTEREINLILFLKKAKSPANIDELQKKVWEYGAKLETHTVETHIYRLRKKLKEKFNDENFIKSLKEGYFIN
tara:strand:+ start:11628 stop:12191 length:564 start_codon:yes stop_codon:yes gene_type:complete